MLRRPPTSTLFPTRRSSDLLAIEDLTVTPRFQQKLLAADRAQAWSADYVELPYGDARAMILNFRSEEHTSELQSQSNLVCRLLLEKKKNKKKNDKTSKNTRT